MPLPNILLLYLLKSKKNISEILSFCKDKKVCQSETFKHELGKMMFKVSGYKTKKDFDYYTLFKEISKIALEFGARDPKKKTSFDINKNQNNLLKLTPAIKKGLAARGNNLVYDYLLYNGIDLRKESAFGINFHISPRESLLSTSFADI